MRIKKHNSFISLFIIIGLTLSNFAYALPDESGDLNGGAEKELNVLKGLNIISPSDKQASMTKGEFILAVMLMRGYDGGKNPNADIPYNDVLPDHKAAGAIMFAVNSGILEVDSESLEPDSDIDADFALYILANAMGYKRIAMINGGYPAGYYKLPITNKLIGKGSSYSGTLTASQSYKMLYNALHTNISKQTNYGVDETFDYSTKNTLMNEYLDIYYDKGMLTANAFASIKGEHSVSKNQVIINDVVYDMGNCDAVPLLGHYVEFYYHMSDDDTDDKKLILIDKNDKEYLKIDAEDISSYSNYTYKYDVDNKRTGTVSFSPTANIIYNGKAVKSEEYSENLFVPLDGYVELIGFENSGDYQTVKITSSYDCMVENISNNNGIYAFSDKYSADYNVLFDINDNDISVFVRNADNKKISADTIAENDILTACMSLDKKLINIAVSKRTEQVCIDAFGDGEITYGDNTIKLSKQIQNVFKTANPIVVGNQSILYLNVYGNVAGVSVISEVTKLGYVVNGMIEKRLPHSLSLKVFHEDGKFSIEKISGNVQIDGFVYKNSNYDQALQCFFSGGVFVPQLVRLSYGNNNEIKKIDTAVVGSAEGENSLVELNPKGVQHPPISGFSGIKYRTSGRYFDGGIFAGEKCKVFAVPIGRFAEDRDYAIKNLDIFVNDQNYDIKAYKTNPLSAEADVIVYSYAPKYSNDPIDLNSTLGAARPFTSSGLLSTGFVNKISTEINDLGESTFKIYLTKLESREDLAYSVRWDDSVSSIKCGDIIRYYVGVTGEVSYIEKVFDCDTRDFNEGQYIFKNSSAETYSIRTHKLTNPRNASFSNDSYAPNTFYAAWRLAYFDVMSVDQGIIKCAMDDVSKGIPSDSLINHFKKSSFANVYQYNKTRKRLEKSNVANIIGYDASPTDYSKILLLSQYGTFINIVIILD